jgi:hypothetical protein
MCRQTIFLELLNNNGLNISFVEEEFYDRRFKPSGTYRSSRGLWMW